MMCPGLRLVTRWLVGSFDSSFGEANFNHKDLTIRQTFLFLLLTLPRRGVYGLDFSKSNLDSIQIQINGLDLKSISILTRSNLNGSFLNPFKVD